MKRYSYSISLFFILFTLAPCYSQTLDTNIFKPLEQELRTHSWNMNNGTKAKLFENIYNKYHNNNSFIQVLADYVSDDTEKAYWLGIFLFEPYYTNINNFELSIHTLIIGLKSATDDSDKVRFYFTIGKMLYNKNRIDEAIMYLVPGYKLSLQYPANVPTFDSIEEYNGIMKIIRDNMN